MGTWTGASKAVRRASLPTAFLLWNYTQPLLQTTGKWVKYKYACWKNISIQINMVQIKHSFFLSFYGTTAWGGPWPPLQSSLLIPCSISQLVYSHLSQVHRHIIQPSRFWSSSASCSLQGPYIYDVKISGFTRSSVYIYDISRLRVKTVLKIFPLPLRKFWNAVLN
jgi:hypothetical protein